MRRAVINHMADRRAGMVQASSNAPIMVLGRAKAAIEIAKMPAETITNNLEIRKIARNLGHRKIPLANTCPKPRATKPCHSPLCLTPSRKAVTQTAEIPTKATLAGLILTQIARTEAADVADKSLYPPLLMGRAVVGVKMWQATIVAYQYAHPHPSLPPVRGKELGIQAFIIIQVNPSFRLVSGEGV